MSATLPASDPGDEVLPELPQDAPPATEPLPTGTTALLQALGTPAAVLDPADACVHAANAAWERSVGTGRVDALDLVMAKDRARLLALLQAASAGQVGDAIQVRLNGGDPGRWVQLSLRPLAEPKTDRWLCTTADIHELRTDRDRLRSHSRVQESLLDASIDCIKLIDATGCLVFMNRAGCEALGVDPAAGWGQRWLDLLPASVREVGQQAIERALTGFSARFAGRSEPEPGVTVLWDNLLTPVLSHDGSVRSILCVARDVTQDVAVQRELAEHRDRLSMATRVGGLGICDLDLATSELFCDDTWHEIMGLGPERRITSVEQYRPLIHPEDVEAATEVRETSAELVRTGEDYTLTYRIVRPDGEIRWVRSAASLVDDGVGVVRRAIGFVVDVTDSRRGQLALQAENDALARERALLEQASLEDPLTGLPNRRALQAELERLAAAPGPVSVAMVGLDHFKRYNDRYGHLGGDEVLTRFAQLLCQAARHSDFVARYGGEEFVLVLPATSDPAPVLQRLLDLLARAAVPHVDSPHGVVTASAGCAVWQGGAEPDWRAVLSCADSALYEAKAAGRARFRVTRLP